MEKIKFDKLAYGDLHAISNAATKYAESIRYLCSRDNTSQQHIHASILNEFRFEVMKKLTKRGTSENNSFKLEIHTAFVLYDALQHYSNQTENQLEAAIIRRLIMNLFSLLPYTSDHETLSIMSDLNYEP